MLVIFWLFCSYFGGGEGEDEGEEEVKVKICVIQFIWNIKCILYIN